MLNAFLSKECVDSLRSIFPLNSKQTERLDNLWLLSAPAFELVEAGEVWFKVRSWDKTDGPTHKQSVSQCKCIRLGKH